MSAENLQNRYFLPNSALARVLEQAPYFARCSDNKTAEKRTPRNLATRYPYMQVNRQDMVSWLVFDLDHQNPFMWEKNGLPTPNLIVTNRKNGHSHLYYAIVPVCTSEKARAKPIQYMKAVYRAMAIRLESDLAYSGTVAKTPGHPWWKTLELHNQVYDLGELADFVDLEVKPWGSPANLDDVSHSRHCLLFEQLRYYAYSIVNEMRTYHSYEHFYSILLTHAEELNNFKPRGFIANLNFSQIKATVKSVARWTWDKYVGDGRCNRGVMGLSNKTLTLKQKQSLAAKRTHEAKRALTLNKLRTAYLELQQQGESITQVALAKLTKLSRQTVAKYSLSDLKGVTADLTRNQPAQQPLVSLSDLVSQKKLLNVNFATYQISPCFLDLKHLIDNGLFDAANEYCYNSNGNDSS